MTRKLASIQKIINIESIEGANNIEKVTILGWQCVVNKGDFKIGDLVVYCEIDSVLPELPEFEFLRERCFVNNTVVKGFRIRTIKLRKTISQGICFPISILNGKKYDNDTRKTPIYNLKEGDDVTALLKVQYFEKPIPAYLQGKVKGRFPDFIPKTDETRVQVLQELLTKYKGIKCYITEKIDGSSLTIFQNNTVLGVCSRNLELAEDDRTYHETPKMVRDSDDNLYLMNEDGEPEGNPITELPKPKENIYWKIVRKYDILEKIQKIGKNIAIQGEIYGEGLQGNPLKIKDIKLAIFNVFDIDENRYYNLKELKDICEQLKLDVVPILDEKYILEDNIQILVEMSKGNSIINKNVKREGIVIRPIVDVYDKSFEGECKKGRISFKSINPEYLAEEQ